MYSGGNEIVRFASPIRAAALAGTVLDPMGVTIPGARIQVQKQGADAIVVDITADDQGRFRLSTLRPGAYWLGISRAGFNLHVWDLRIVRFGGTKNLRAEISLGT